MKEPRTGNRRAPTGKFRAAPAYLNLKFFWWNDPSMLEFLNKKNGGEWASLPVAVFYTKDFQELHRYFEYPAIYHKDRIRGFQQAARPGETEAQAKDRERGEFVAMQGSPFFDIWASAGVDEILSALHEKLTVKG